MDAQNTKKTYMKKCEVCNKNIHSSSFAKHLRSKTHQENEMIIPPRFFLEKEQKTKKTNTPTPRDENNKTNIGGLNVYEIRDKLKDYRGGFEIIGEIKMDQDKKNKYEV